NSLNAERGTSRLQKAESDKLDFADACRRSRGAEPEWRAQADSLARIGVSGLQQQHKTISKLQRAPKSEQVRWSSASRRSGRQLGSLAEAGDSKREVEKEGETSNRDNRATAQDVQELEKEASRVAKQPESGAQHSCQLARPAYSREDPLARVSIQRSDNRLAIDTKRSKRPCPTLQSRLHKLDKDYAKLLADYEQLRQLHETAALQAEPLKQRKAGSGLRTRLAEIDRLTKEAESFKHLQEALENETKNMGRRLASVCSVFRPAGRDQQRLLAAKDKCEQDLRMLSADAGSMRRHRPALEATESAVKPGEIHFDGRAALLLTQNQELLTQTLQFKDNYNIEERTTARTALIALQRQKERLEDKIMDQYKAYSPAKKTAPTQPTAVETMDDDTLAGSQPPPERRSASPSARRFVDNCTGLRLLIGDVPGRQLRRPPCRIISERGHEFLIGRGSATAARPAAGSARPDESVRRPCPVSQALYIAIGRSGGAAVAARAPSVRSSICDAQQLPSAVSGLPAANSTGPKFGDMRFHDARPQIIGNIAGSVILFSSKLRRTIFSGQQPAPQQQQHPVPPRRQGKRRIRMVP
uniref:Lebercilin domain-containing protein n=1 Tax=Macrostomum lignano TaxID=282301 RepID=A0A1I8FLG3_9PLAT